MRIFFLTSYGRKIGGTESYLNVIVPAYLHRGHVVGICYTAEGPLNRQAFEFPGEIRQWRLANANHKTVLYEIKDWKPDLIFCHGTTDLQFEAEILKLAPGIFFAHDYYGTCISGLKTHKFPTPIPCSRVFGPGCLARYFPRRCGGRSPVTMIRLYAKQVQRLQRLRGYAMIATNSDHLSAEYERHGFATRRLPYPVFADNSERPRTIRAGADKSWRLLFAGRMDRLKGGQVLLEALPAIRSGTGRDLQLTLVGDGPERSRWEKIAKKTQSANPGLHIEFKGWLDRATLARAYAEADLLVVPSLWPEPCGVVGVEAALYAVPAVAFAVGGIPDWLLSGENGFLAPADPPTAFGLADAAVRALDPLNHERLCAGARKLALRWTLEKHCDEFDRLVARVMQVAAPFSVETVQAEISSPVSG